MPLMLLMLARQEVWKRGYYISCTHSSALHACRWPRQHETGHACALHPIGVTARLRVWSAHIYPACRHHRDMHQRQAAQAAWDRMCMCAAAQVALLPVPGPRLWYTSIHLAARHSAGRHRDLHPSANFQLGSGLQDLSQAPGGPHPLQGRCSLMSMQGFRLGHLWQPQPGPRLGCPAGAPATAAARPPPPGWWRRLHSCPAAPGSATGSCGPCTPACGASDPGQDLVLHSLDQSVIAKLPSMTRAHFTSIPGPGY